MDRAATSYQKTRAEALHSRRLPRKFLHEGPVLTRSTFDGRTCLL